MYSKTQIKLLRYLMQEIGMEGSPYPNKIRIKQLAKKVAIKIKIMPLSIYFPYKLYGGVVTLDSIFHLLPFENACKLLDLFLEVIENKENIIVKSENVHTPVYNAHRDLEPLVNKAKSHIRLLARGLINPDEHTKICKDLDKILLEIIEYFSEEVIKVPVRINFIDRFFFRFKKRLKFSV